MTKVDNSSVGSDDTVLCMPARVGLRGAVTVCHLVKATIHPNGYTTVVGHVIQVPESALSAHLGHGDMEITGPPPPRGACCSFQVTPPTN